MTAPAVQVAAPADWAAGLAPGARALAAALAERHLPLTPLLARHLAAFMAGPEGFWGRGYHLASQALGLPGRFGHGAAWARIRPVFVAAVVEPVLRHSAGVTGVLPLCGTAGLDDVRFAGACTRIEAAVDAALASEAVMGRGFWQLAGLALAGAATDPRGRKAPLPPEIEAPVARLLFGLDPVFPPEAARQRRLRRPQPSPRRRSGMIPPEGGVTGIRHSRRLEDMGDALLTELLIPEELVALKLLDEGMMVRHRPPRRDPRRDLLVITLADRRDEGPGGALVKAAWADAGLRLRLLLAQAGLAGSDQLWAEAGPVGTRAAVLRGAGAVVAPGIDPMRLAGTPRAAALMASGLIPGFLDLLPDPARPHPVAEGDEGAVMADLLRRALGALAQPLAATPRPDDYGQRLVLVAPQPGGALARAMLADWPDLRRSLAGAFRRLLGAGPLAVAAILPPGELVRGAVLTRAPMAGTILADDPLPAEGEAAEVLAQALGLVSGWMIGQVAEVLDAA